MVLDNTTEIRDEDDNEFKFPKPFTRTDSISKMRPNYSGDKTPVYTPELQNKKIILLLLSNNNNNIL